MEESLFENTCVCSQQMLNDVYEKRAKTSLTRIAITDILMIIIIGFYVWSTHWYAMGLVFVSLFAILNVLELIIMPRRQAKMEYKRVMDLYHSEQTYETIIYPDHMFVKNVLSKGEVDLTYDKIAELNDTKQAYILKLKQKTYLIVQKDGFTKGSALDFVNFMRSKGIERKF